MNSHSSLNWIDDALAEWDAQGLRRKLVTRSGPQGAKINVRGRTLLNFGANDYLGLANDPRLIIAAEDTAAKEGWGAGASPLITGHTAAHAALETQLADWHGTEAALVTPSGFAANAGTIAALVDAGDVIFSDAKNHASLIDGCRLSRARVEIYPHNDVAALRELLQRTARAARRRLIVTDTVFSMDGDTARLPELCDLAEQYDTMLLVDEAHATGVFGADGTGLAEEQGVAARIPIRIGTLSKALGSGGGFVASEQRLIDWLVNRARPYVFSTAHPPATAAASSAAIRIVLREPQRRTELLARAAWLRTELRRQGWQLGDAATQIIPIIVGEAATAMRLHQELLEAGNFVPGIRPPSVPAGESLLRISLSYAHQQADLQELAAQLARLR
jgi:8-amino-7-oxononanoate synthase